MVMYKNGAGGYDCIEEMCRNVYFLEFEAVDIKSERVIKETLFALMYLDQLLYLYCINL